MRSCGNNFRNARWDDGKVMVQGVYGGGAVAGAERVDDVGVDAMDTSGV